MFKKIYRGFIIGTLLLILVPSMHPIQASWPDNNFFASIISSIWQRIITLPDILLPARTPQKSPPDSSGTKSPSPSPEAPVVSTGCYPPLPPKPAGSDTDGRYGPMTITPVVSTAGLANVIKTSITPDFTPTEVTLSIGNLFVEDILDWGPKDLNGGKFVKEQGKLGWYAGKTSLLPEKIPYWLTLRANRPTVPAQVPYVETYNTSVYDTFWGSMGYRIGNADQGISFGRHAYLINGPQTPRLFLDIPKEIVVEPNGNFEVKARSKWQAGTISLDTMHSGVKILGEKTVTAGANELKTWRIQPLYNEENTIGLVARLKNNCGQDSTQVEGLKIKYDYSKLTPDTVDISMEQSFPIGLGTSIQSGVGITLYTKPATKLGVPNITFTVRAVYADSREEIVKNVLLSSSRGTTWQAGETTTKTTSVGLAPLLVKAPKLTAQEAKRKIILIAQTNDIKGLMTETSLNIRISAVPTVSVVPSVPTVTAAVIKSIAVVADRSLDGLKEGDKVHFNVSASMLDGSKKILTKNVAWAVVGKIGSIDAAGVFTAKLDESIAEYGEGVGAVTATYNEFFSTTPPFRVEAFAPDEGTGPDRG
ncbi:MAG: hypothetical protein Q8R40_05830 [bacterium]|nr:hypothetical protein [bacterium]